MRGPTLPLARTKTHGSISVDLREKVEFLSLPLSFLSLFLAPFLSLKAGLSQKLPFPFFCLTFLIFFSFLFYFIFPFIFFLSFFFHLVLIQPNSPVAPLPFLLNFHFFSFSLLFHLTFFPLFLHLTHDSK